ncbi:MAG: hypothetical protein AB9888_01340 [Bacteroidales bacterium]
MTNISGQSRYPSISGINGFTDYFVSKYGNSVIKSVELIVGALSVDSLEGALEEAAEFNYVFCYDEPQLISVEDCDKTMILALLSYWELVQRGVSSREVYYHCAVVKQRLGYHQEAIIDFTSALHLKSQSTISDQSIVSDRGRAKLKIDDFYGAIEDFSNVIELCGNSTEWTTRTTTLGFAYIRRGEAYVMLSKCKLAINDLNKALEIGTILNKEAYFWRGIANLGLNKVEEGCLDLSKANELGHKGAYDAIVEFCNK